MAIDDTEIVPGRPPTLRPRRDDDFVIATVALVTAIFCLTSHSLFEGLCFIGLGYSIWWIVAKLTGGT